MLAAVVALAGCHASSSSGGDVAVDATPTAPPGPPVDLPVAPFAVHDHPDVAALSPRLVSSLGGPGCSVAIDAGHVYWTARDSVRKVARTGGAEEVVADHQGQPTAVAVDSGRVYWTAQGPRRVRQASLAGGAWGGLAADQDTPLGITVDDGFVYWTNAGFNELPTANTVVKAAKGGGAPVVLSQEPKKAKPGSIAVDGQAIYWADENEGHAGTLRRIAKGGGPVTTLASGQMRPGSIALDDAFAYWVDSWLDADGSVLRVAKSGGDPQTVYQQSRGAAPTGLALDSSSVYFSDSWGGIHRVPKTGGPAVKLADIPGGGGTAAALAIDDTSLWVCGEAGLWRLTWETTAKKR